MLLCTFMISAAICALPFNFTHLHLPLFYLLETSFYLFLFVVCLSWCWEFLMDSGCWWLLFLLLLFWFLIFFFSFFPPFCCFETESPYVALNSLYSQDSPELIILSSTRVIGIGIHYRTPIACML